MRFGRIFFGKGGERVTSRFSNRQIKFNDYDGFVEKFVPKKTTDDCYTPANIYEIVAGYVTETYGVNRSEMVRPFWPGGDYEAFEYPTNCCVVDNPPFSIISQICKNYIRAGIRFFLFCPYLTAISISKSTGKAVTLIIAPVGIEYENGARVNTSFVTNLEPGTALRTDPELLDRLTTVNSENMGKKRVQLPKYAYPREILTVAMAGEYAKRHVSYRLDASECAVISDLDEQKQHGKSIFGSGFLLSERAAAERTAAERTAAERTAAEQVITWNLSPKEKLIQMAIGKTRSVENEGKDKFEDEIRTDWA